MDYVCNRTWKLVTRCDILYRKVTRPWFPVYTFKGTVSLTTMTHVALATQIWSSSPGKWNVLCHQHSSPFLRTNVSSSMQTAQLSCINRQRIFFLLRTNYSTWKRALINFIITCVFICSLSFRYFLVRKILQLYC